MNRHDRRAQAARKTDDASRDALVEFDAMLERFAETWRLLMDTLSACKRDPDLAASGLGPAATLWVVRRLRPWLDDRRRELDAATATHETDPNKELH
jgi:hypothetical protein